MSGDIISYMLRIYDPPGNALDIVRCLFASLIDIGADIMSGDIISYIYSGIITSVLMFPKFFYFSLLIYFIICKVYAFLCLIILVFLLWTILRLPQAASAINTYEKYSSYFHRIMIDDELGGYLATRHLIEFGHRHIIFATGSIFRQELLIEGPVTFDRGYHIGRQPIETDGDATVVRYTT